jgi:hypothetical protein
MVLLIFEIQIVRKIKDGVTGFSRDAIFELNLNDSI